MAARICTNPTGELFFNGSMKEPIEMVHASDSHENDNY